MQTSIYQLKINPWLELNFRLFLKVKLKVLELPITVIKDKAIFISILFGTGKTPIARKITFNRAMAPYLDWDLIDELASRHLNIKPDCIECNTDGFFNFEKYPDSFWLGEISETIKPKDTEKRNEQ